MEKMVKLDDNNGMVVTKITTTDIQLYQQKIYEKFIICCDIAWAKSEKPNIFLMGWKKIIIKAYVLYALYNNNNRGVKRKNKFNDDTLWIISVKRKKN